MNDTLTRPRNVDDMIQHAIQHASNALDASARRASLFGRQVPEPPLADWEREILTGPPEAPAVTPGTVLTNRKARLEREAAEAAAPLRLAYSTSTPGRCEQTGLASGGCDHCRCQGDFLCGTCNRCLGR